MGSKHTYANINEDPKLNVQVWIELFTFVVQEQDWVFDNVQCGEDVGAPNFLKSVKSVRNKAEEKKKEKKNIKLG